MKMKSLCRRLSLKWSPLHSVLSPTHTVCIHSTTFIPPPLPLPGCVGSLRSTVLVVPRSPPVWRRGFVKAPIPSQTQSGHMSRKKVCLCVHARISTVTGYFISNYCSGNGLGGGGQALSRTNILRGQKHPLPLWNVMCYSYKGHSTCPITDYGKAMPVPRHTWVSTPYFTCMYFSLDSIASIK